jgi:inorganic pyrophosphatase
MKMLLKTNKTIAICWMAVFLLAGCTPNANNKTAKQLKNSAYVLVGEKHFLHDYEPYSESGTVNVVVEIPAGTLEKWEVDKTDGSMKLEFIGQNPRIVQYLAYPGNYGMIPKTILPLEQGGDGDPLDVIVLGEASLRGAVIDCKVIGVMLMRDNGEQDDKLIAVKSNSPFFNINSIAELNEKFPGVSDILKIWFLNYKGVGKIEVSGFAEKEAAEKILSTAIHEFKKSTL